MSLSYEANHNNQSFDTLRVQIEDGQIELRSPPGGYVDLTFSEFEAIAAEIEKFKKARDIMDNPV